jgi:hypothetical protein
MPINKEKSKTCFVTMNIKRVEQIEALMRNRNVKSLSRQLGYMLDQYMETRRIIKESMGTDVDSIADVVKIILKNK